MDPIHDQRSGKNETGLGLEKKSGLGGGEEGIEIIQRIVHLRGKIAFKVADDARNSAGEEPEAAANAADEERIEAVKTGENFTARIGRLVGLLAIEKGVGVRAIKENDPVARQFGVKDRDEINLR